MLLLFIFGRLLFVRKRREIKVRDGKKRRMEEVYLNCIWQLIVNESL
jgi:hypothetical protein